jgi:Cu(I)/Ag(I) efflux system membrane fusion protein
VTGPTSRYTGLIRGLLVVAALAVAFAAGFLLREAGPGPGAPGPAAADATESRHDHDGSDANVWTCSMHPQIRLPEPGQCPICFMDLVPVETGAAEATHDAPSLALSETARRLARVRTAPVRRAHPTVEVRMVGRVDYDETKVGSITAYVPGRLDRLYVDHTWTLVNQGDHMADIYSPDLIAAQGELVQAIAAERALANSDLPIMRETAAKTVEAARERLRLWGLRPEQIGDVEERGVASDHVTLYSPLSGVVMEMNATQGTYVQTGTRIYTVVDLSTVWVRLQAFESDLEWVHLGQEVEFSTEAYPGERFDGQVAFIEPVVDPRTRTVDLRVIVDNGDGRLKPEMLVRAVLRARVAGSGRVFDPELADKWISPMHPWVVKDGPGQCDVCGMDLVPSEELGYAPADEPGSAPLVVPASAPLLTGKRAVVYVERDGEDGPTYEGREVVLGPRAGDVYVVRSGLREGERVVVEGNFKIDSALQIQARPSMMGPASEDGP